MVTKTLFILFLLHMCGQLYKNRLTIKSVVKTVCKPVKFDFQMDSEHATALEKEHATNQLLDPLSAHVVVGH